jgi:two-component system response regulator YesN
MNPNYCCRLFKKYTKSTFSEYINNLRLETAVKLLKTTEFTIEEIAQRTGYNDYFYFIKLFKKNYGVPPARFRKEFLCNKTSGV